MPANIDESPNTQHENIARYKIFLHLASRYFPSAICVSLGIVSSAIAIVYTPQIIASIASLKATALALSALSTVTASIATLLAPLAKLSFMLNAFNPFVYGASAIYSSILPMAHHLVNVSLFYGQMITSNTMLFPILGFGKTFANISGALALMAAAIDFVCVELSLMFKNMTYDPKVPHVTKTVDETKAALNHIFDNDIVRLDNKNYTVRRPVAFLSTLSYGLADRASTKCQEGAKSLLDKAIELTHGLKRHAKSP